MKLSRSSRGFALNLTGAACLGALACGPNQASQEGGETDGSMESGTEESPSESDTDSDPDPTETDPTETDTNDPEPECDYPGTVCGELSVCRCDSDTDVDSCACVDVACMEDQHCEGEQICGMIGAPQQVNYLCLPDYCEQSISGEELYAGHEYSGSVCVDSLLVYAITWTDLTPLANLRFVNQGLEILSNDELVNLDGLAALEQVGSLSIGGNQALTSVQALAGLQGINEGGSIRNNPLLPTAAVEALLSQIPGGELVEVCGNLDGDPC
jgi:hypothetical protein